ncbi:sulfite exporter TauE/SafE family protein [Sediminibacillus massiliensis]|uniref:sulfite exporter TauE/SafE family protein n=1 Tax=Sediminibacillus massiliensis TaxID=1926277 RepID=UPI0009886B26|nr:sulfite exporter TauE/SafE family protein [Sediminibacillus massiliensis]
MLTYLVAFILFSNFFVGILLGISSIGGFLLPLIFVGFLQLPLRDSLALSFFSFAVAGLIGAYYYWKAGNMDVKLATYLSIGSIPGALIGVKLNVLIPDDTAKLLLYLFVLLSGISLLVKNKNSNNNGPNGITKSRILDSKASILIIGLISAAICSLTGAGGPILLVPLLSNLGISIRVAVGVCLLNSVVIAIPSVFGYFQYTDMDNFAILLAASILGQIIGTMIGSFLSNKVKLNHLSVSIALLTVVSSTYMIIVLFI